MVISRGTEAGSYLKLLESCITQLKAQRTSSTCHESEEEEEEEARMTAEAENAV